MIKLLYKPVSILASVLSGVLAGSIFKRVWKAAVGQDEAPKATDAARGWREVLVAATLQGAIFALVKAAVDRGAAVGTRRRTGFWPGEDSAAQAAATAHDATAGGQGKARGTAQGGRRR